jgi:hypothetical protein
MKSLEALTLSDPPLGCAVVLLDDVVQVPDGPAPATLSELKRTADLGRGCAR